MSAPAVVRPGDRVSLADQRIVLHRVPWSHFEAILALRGDGPTPRKTYFQGELELMSPAQTHERINGVTEEIRKNNRIDRPETGAAERAAA